MTGIKKTPQKPSADVIRAEIKKIPSGELKYAKPSRILPGLEAAGYEITNSVKSSTSKLLAKAKDAAGFSDEGQIISVDPTTIESATRMGLAMRLVEACEGNFELVRSEIARLEQFAKKCSGA